VGIHTHNDSDLAVANALAAVDAGATQVQGTINGLGERCGNVDLCSVIPNLVLKKKLSCAAGKNLHKLTELSRYLYETANLSLRTSQPFVGMSAFAHKAGMHVHAVQKNERTYEHISPESVGNERRILISELSGSANVLAKVERRSLTQDKDLARKIVKEVQQLENAGYQFEAAEASFELLVKKITGAHKRFFDLEGFSVHVDKREDGSPITWATVKLKVKGDVEMTASDGDGPVNALDGALRKALEKHYPSLKEMRLTDYKVRVVNPKAGTAAKVRVIIESADREGLWGTVGVSENVIEASYQALVDSIEYKLLKEK
jgi:2-isopropylmalate synthase